jgi:hypothetical protein
MRRILHGLARLYSKVYPRRGGGRSVITFFSNPPYYGNARAVYEYIRSQGLDEKYDLELVWLVWPGADTRSLERNNVKYCN